MCFICACVLVQHGWRTLTSIYQVTKETWPLINIWFSATWAECVRVCVCVLTLDSCVVHLLHSRGCGAGPTSVSAEGRGAVTAGVGPLLTFVVSETAGWAKMAPVAQRGVLKILTSYLISLPLPLGPSSAINPMKIQSEGEWNELGWDCSSPQFFLSNFYQHFLTMMHLKAAILREVCASLAHFTVHVFISNLIKWLPSLVLLHWKACLKANDRGQRTQPCGEPADKTKESEPFTRAPCFYLLHNQTAIRQLVGQNKNISKDSVEAY